MAEIEPEAATMDETPPGPIRERSLRGSSSDTRTRDPSEEPFRVVVWPIIEEAHDRLAATAARHS